MKGKDSVRPTPSRTDHRVQKSRQAVLAATYQLMSEEGLGGVSIDEVVRISGVAKTTIYRHWPSRTTLLLEACSQMGDVFEAPDTGTLRGDVMVLAMAIATRLTSGRWCAILPSVLDAAERDETMAEMLKHQHSVFMTPLYEALARARKRGELPPGRRPTDIVAAIVGPMFYRRWFSREALNKAFVHHIVDIALGGDATAAPRKSTRKKPGR